tara:strand:+ start:384 stop:545 length:162 start_codon:yes stop_codon:yes gene_type:complete
MASPDAAPLGRSAVVQMNQGWALTTPTPDSGSTSKNSLSKMPLPVLAKPPDGV